MNEYEEELRRVLHTVRPVIDWSTALRATGLDGPEVWSRDDPDSWPMSGPPEEYALPPLVLWSDDLRLLTEQAYRHTHDRFLEPGESYELVWPPRGSLWDAGSWRHVFSDDDDPPDEDGEVVVEPASWSWEVAVERVAGNGVEDEQPWFMGRTPVDPRVVEYGLFGGDGAHSYVEVLQRVVRSQGR